MERQKTKGLCRNAEGKMSGAKLILLAACLLASAWLLRDLWAGKDLGEWHSVLLGALLAVGLFNRLSARGRLKLRFKDCEVEAEDRAPES